MKKLFFTVFLILSSIVLKAQELDTINNSGIINIDDFNPNAKKKGTKDKKEQKAVYTDYKIISFERDTIVVDTTLTIYKDYRMNYLMKDDFELLSFHNQGQVFNQLGYNLNNNYTLPQSGATAKHINYFQIEDVDYYDVPTPTTELFYLSGIQQGQMLDAWFAANLSRDLNISFAYKGLRSLGDYRESLSSHKSFRGTISYRSKNKRYQLRAHNTNQTLKNQESGGLTPTSLEAFETGNPDFDDRGRLDINLTDADSDLVGKRYYLDHTFKLFKDASDSIQKISNLQLGHTFVYETKQYKFSSVETDFFGDSFKEETGDKSSDKTMDNSVYLNFTSPFVLGNFKVNINNHHYFHGYTSSVVTGDGVIPSEIRGNIVSVGADWNANIKNIYFSANANTSISGNLYGRNLNLKAAYKTQNGFELSGALFSNTKAPNLNFLLFQSNFTEYNWYNDFDNVQTNGLEFSLNSKWIQLSASSTIINNYVYFKDNSVNSIEAPVTVTPTQFGGTVNYNKLKASNEFKLGKFALNNTLLFQNVSSGTEVFKVPEFVTRNTFYYTNYLFKKKSLLLNTGITVNYFTAYNANSYNAVLGEFTVQNHTDIGNYPTFDYFINGEVRRTRIFLKFENFLSSYSANNYLSAPGYPYRDFAVRFGIVWNFFN